MPVITFSRVFPGYHPRAGEPTYFVEQILNSIGYRQFKKEMPPSVKDIINDFVILDGATKHHTIRAGNRWKVGDKFSPRVWGEDVNPTSGRTGPYQSKQITIGPDIEVRKVWDFKMYSTDKHCHIELNGVEFNPVKIEDFYQLMKNDGLAPEDFRQWFQFSPQYRKTKKFTGQIICWNDQINY